VGVLCGNAVGVLEVTVGTVPEAHAASRLASHIVSTHLIDHRSDFLSMFFLPLFPWKAFAREYSLHDDIYVGPDDESEMAGISFLSLIKRTKWSNRQLKNRYLHHTTFSPTEGLTSSYFSIL
jgi:hypothetical protein